MEEINISNLPGVLITQIFRYLDEEALKMVSGVCKDWSKEAGKRFESLVKTFLPNSLEPTDPMMTWKVKWFGTKRIQRMVRNNWKQNKISNFKDESIPSSKPIINGDIVKLFSKLGKQEKLISTSLFEDMLAVACEPNKIELFSYQGENLTLIRSFTFESESQEKSPNELEMIRQISLTAELFLQVVTTKDRFIVYQPDLLINDPIFVKCTFFV